MRAITNICLFAACTAVLISGCAKSETDASEFPAYENDLAPRIIDGSGVGLTGREQTQLVELTETAAAILYNVGEDYDPADAATFIKDTDPSELQAQAKMYTVKSQVKNVQVLDIKVNGGNSVNILASLTLDFESKNKAQGEYLFVLDILAERTDSGWICAEVLAETSALANEASIVRDDLTGDAKIVFIGENAE